MARRGGRDADVARAGRGRQGVARRRGRLAGGRRARAVTWATGGRHPAPRSPQPDCAMLAKRLGVPHVLVPDDVPGSPFAFVPVKRWRRWRESALWWPEHRTLAVAEALGTNRFFTGGDTPVGVHLLLRLTPPTMLGSATSPTASSSGTARACPDRRRSRRSRPRCERAGAGSQDCSCACRSPAAARKTRKLRAGRGGRAAAERRGPHPSPTGCAAPRAQERRTTRELAPRAAPRRASCAGVGNVPRCG